MPSESPTRLERIQKKALNLLQDKEVDPAQLHHLSRPEKFIHFCGLVVKSFFRNRGPVRASALAYTTLLALIPLLAVAVSVSTALLTKEGGKPIQGLIDKMVGSVAPALNLELKTDGTDGNAGSQEVARKINGFIANIHSGALGVTSVIALVFVSISLLRTIEAAFNDIWGVSQGRSWGASIIRYWAAISLGPLILTVALGLTTGPHLARSKEWVSAMPFLGHTLFKLLPFVMLGLAFAIFYQLMPNTKVQWKAALVGGMVSGVLWQLNNMFNVIYVSNAVTYTNIYGSLGLIPLFLVGLYFSWFILLFGAQVAYAFQNRQTYLKDRQAERVHQRGKEFAALRLMAIIGERFQDGAKAASVDELSQLGGIPSQLTLQLLCFLTEAGLLQEVTDKEVCFAPKRPLDKITPQDIIQAIRAGRGEDLAANQEPAQEVLRREFQRILGSEREAAEAVNLQQLIFQIQTARSKTGLA